MVRDYQPDQYFQLFVKDILMEEVMHSRNQNLPTIQGLDKVMQLCT